MKKILSIIITIMLFSTTCISASADDEISVYLDAKKIEFDVKPQIINERTMVPIRAIFEEMGAVVEWDQSTSTAISTKGDTIVKMTVNSMDMYVNNQLVKMDTSPVVIDGRTLAPARYVAEAFGANVQWCQKNNTVVICSKDVYAYADYPDIPDLGKCYNIPLLNESIDEGYRFFYYEYKDMSNDDYYSYIYDHSALVLGNYAEETIDYTDGVLTISYTKSGETTPRYYIGVTYTESGSMFFAVMIPDSENSSNPLKETTKYYDATNEVNQIRDFISSGLYLEAIQICEETLAWHDLSESDKSLINGLKNDAESRYNTYLYNEENKKNTNNSSTSNNSQADGYYYRTPTGKKYHLDPDCGGKNSYRTTNISGLSPCSKCAQ